MQSNDTLLVPENSGEPVTYPLHVHLAIAAVIVVGYLAGYFFLPAVWQ